jgi:hypothetical protein
MHLRKQRPAARAEQTQQTKRAWIAPLVALQWLSEWVAYATGNWTFLDAFLQGVRFENFTGSPLRICETRVFLVSRTRRRALWNGPSTTSRRGRTPERENRVNVW